MDDLRFNKFFRSLGQKYWDCVSDEKMAEQFAIADSVRPVSPVFFNYCASRIDVYGLWAKQQAIAKNEVKQ